MKKILLAISLFSSSVFSQQITITKVILDDFVKIEIKNLLKVQCVVNKKDIIVKLNNEKGLVIIPFENCGGKINYGQLVYGFKSANIDFKENEQIIGISKTKLEVNNIQDVLLTKDGFDILFNEASIDTINCCTVKIEKVSF